MNTTDKFVNMIVGFTILGCLSVLLIAFLQVSSNGISDVIGEDEENPNFFQKLFASEIFQLLSGGAMFILLIVFILITSGVLSKP